MASLLHQLENNDAVLLMYLAGELPSDDRAEVEQHLRMDANLRRELDSLRGVENMLTLAMSEADGVGLTPAAEALRQASVVRRVSRAMVMARAESERKAIVLERLPSERRLRLPTWAYPFAAAAMIVVGFVAYWGLSNGGPTKIVDRESPVHSEMAEDFQGGYSSQPSPQEDPARRSVAVFHSMGVDEGDRDMLAISAGAYDVSSMFQADLE